jgi:hypothetical protein
LVDLSHAQRVEAHCGIRLPRVPERLHFFPGIPKRISAVGCNFGLGPDRTQWSCEIPARSGMLSRGRRSGPVPMNRQARHPLSWPRPQVAREREADAAPGSCRSPVDCGFGLQTRCSQSTIGCRMTGGAETCHSQSIRMSDRCTSGADSHSFKAAVTRHSGPFSDSFLGR